MRIVFVRHGEPDYAHDCLTERGRIQAQAAAERIAETTEKAAAQTPVEIPAPVNNTND